MKSKSKGNCWYCFLAASKIVSKEVDREKYLDVVDDLLKEAK